MTSFTQLVDGTSSVFAGVAFFSFKMLVSFQANGKKKSRKLNSCHHMHWHKHLDEFVMHLCVTVCDSEGFQAGRLLTC